MKLTTRELEAVRKQIRSLVVGGKAYTVIRIPVSSFRCHPPMVDETQVKVEAEPVIICKAVWYKDRDGKLDRRWEIDCTPVISIDDHKEP